MTKEDIKDNLTMLLFGLILCGIVLSIGLLLHSCAGSEENNNSKSYSETMEEVWDFSKTEVQNRLKSPATASFPEREKANILERSKGGYKVTGYVDSENGFGANIRTHFVVIIDEDEYGILTLEDIDFIT